MPDWSWFGSFLDFCAVYFTTQLVRCAVFSFMLTGIVMPLRKLLFSKQIFLRGMLWIFFIIVPFCGKLKLFYENATVIRATWWMTGIPISCLNVDRIYMAGIFVTAICIFGRRLRFRMTVAGMEKMMFENIRVRVTDMNVTPFTAGLMKPQIVLPRVMADSFSRDELKAIIQHEQTHIRLGHLWFGFLWDILRCLLWLNPFLTIFQKHLRADMEAVCDRVCIQNSGKTAHEYGLVLLKSLKLLRSGREDIPTAVTYAGEKGFADMKSRMAEIAGFRPYPERLCMGMASGAFLAIVIILLCIHTHSYARCNESNDIMICKYEREAEAAIISHDTEDLSRMISYDDRYVYVDVEAFEDFLCQNNAEGEIYIYFGGFYKLPGLGGAAETCFYERNSKNEIIQISYESIRDNWYYKLFKWL